MRRSEYANRDPLDPTIHRGDTDPAKLTLEQVRTLVGWADCQHCDYFTDAPLRMILGLFHASKPYEDFQSWHDEEPKDAAEAYNRYARFNNMLPIYGGK